MANCRILLVEDDPQALESMKKLLERESFEVLCARDGSEALSWIRKHSGSPEFVDVIISDVRMPHLDGIGLLRSVVACEIRIPFILMTAFGEVDDAVEAMKLGAIDFISKPFKRKTLIDAISRALKSRRVADRQKISSDVPGVTGTSEKIQALQRMIEKIARTQANVLLRGESGTGKERVARLIHEGGPRAKKPYVTLNCSAIPVTLIESELFGYVKGAFTGADRDRKGLFESAHGGTIFLDEIGDMPIELQAKLLRVLQEREIRPVGSTKAISVDVRVISATHRKLEEDVASGRFREDLLFRLDVLTVRIPALRERTEDIPILCTDLVRSYCERSGTELIPISEEAMKVLLSHSWPGNVRELGNVLERAAILCDGMILPSDLPEHLLTNENRMQASPRNSQVSIPLGMPLKEVEALLLEKALEASAGDKEAAAKLLGVNARTIYRKTRKETDRL